MLARIRDATASDALALANVHVLSWKFAHRGLFPDEVVEGLSFEERERSWRETRFGGCRDPVPGELDLRAWPALTQATSCAAPGASGRGSRLPSTRPRAAPPTA